MQLTNYRLLLFLLVLWILVPSHTIAQIQRYEMGKRLRRFEMAWQEASSENRAASALPMISAVRSFFGGRFAEAARQLDKSWFAAAGVEPDVFQRDAIAWSCRLIPAACDSDRSSVQVKLESLYETAELPDSTTIQWSLVHSTDGTVVISDEKLLEEARAGTWNWRPAGIPAADYRVEARLVSGEQTVELGQSSYSLIENFDERLVDLEKGLQGMRGQLEDSLYYTSRDLSRILRSLHSGEVQEIDYPANRLLEFAELVVADPQRAVQNIGEQARQADVWMTLAQKRRRVPVRVRAPAETASELPVLFLFHGAGGSENMFFETCGAGRCVSEGLQRGWLVVAPRQISGRLVLDCAAMLDELEEFFDVDRSRVYLVGHSMGGGQVVRQVARHPRLARGAAVLGGGGRTDDYTALASTPWFIAAGELDFGRRGAIDLSRRLQQSGAEARYREFEDVEHMVIVQAATGELFEFLDQISAD